MITAKVEDKHVEIKAAGTSAELAADILRMINALYDDLLESDTCMKLAASTFRTTIMLFIEDALDYNKLEVGTNESD